MKLQIQIDVEKLSEFSFDTQTNLSELMDNIVNRVIGQGAIADNLRHPILGVALSYKVIPDSTDISLTEEDVDQVINDLVAAGEIEVKQEDAQTEPLQVTHEPQAAQGV